MTFLILLNIITSLWGSFSEISRVNDLKAEGEKAYLDKNYPEAIQKYNSLIYHFQSRNEPVRMNLAHAYYKNNDTIEAAFHYKKLTSSTDPHIRSVANQQLGLIKAIQKQNNKALAFFKEALKSDPENESARFNYELMIKKIAEENKKQNQSSDEKKEEDKKQHGDNSKEDDTRTNSENKKNKTSRKEDPQGNIEGEYQSSSANQEGQENGQKEESEENSGSGGEENLKNEELELNEKGSNQRKALISRRLKNINMTEERARMILESMKNTETQYLQQIKKSGKPKYGESKPDW